MSSGSSKEVDITSGRLRGARADYVASLGRKVHDARELVAALKDDPSSKQARDELRRRLHALGAGARLLRFEAMFRSLREALAVLDQGALRGWLREQEMALVGRVVEDLPALAWVETRPGSETPSSGPPGNEPRPGETPGSDPPGEFSPVAAVAGPGEEGMAPVGAAPIAVLVVGGEELADALGEDGALRPRTFESERTDHPRTALQLARAYAPDLMLVDVDLLDAAELVDALLLDPLTEAVPIVVVGTFSTPEDVARILALGVARVLSRPVAPDALARALDEILEAAREGRSARLTLGEPTLEQLVTRLSEELRRGLLESVERTARSSPIPLGEGTEVLGALWSAMARVQAIVSQKTDGAVRFAGVAPEGSVALAPWLRGDVPGSERLGGRGRGAGAEVHLSGRRVMVADDDPGVTWFMSDLLRTAGCEVHEAFDGASALTLAQRIQPELVVSDILMPRMDGFALSRALRRDVALRDVPVILLSWKEDLLQRARELGASAAAYMRKETDSHSILARVREVLRPRARVEMRLRGDGEVRGRLDGLSARLLLELVGAARGDARVAVRDASCLYEIEIRAGAPRKATRTATDGGYQRGESVLRGLPGVGAGRFVVSPSAAPIRGELTGTLPDQLAPLIAAARGAVAASTGAQTMSVGRLALDPASLQDFLRATPDPARAMIQRLAEGASPRQMLLAGEIAPALLEDVLVDLAWRGAIVAVQGLEGEDLLTRAVEAALAVLHGEPTPVRAGRHESIAPSDPPPPIRPATPGDDPPSSLEDAIMREVSERSPDADGPHLPASDLPAIVEPVALRRRSMNPPANDPRTPVTVDESRLPGSLPPDAVVANLALEPFPVSPSAPSTVMRPSPTPSSVTSEDRTEPRPPSEIETEPEYDTDVEAMYAPPFALTAQRPPPPVWGAPAPTVGESTRPLPLPSVASAEGPAPGPRGIPRRSPWSTLAALAVLGLAVGALLHVGNRQTQRPPAPSMAATPEVIPAPAPTLATAVLAESAPSPTPIDPGDELPPGAEVPPGFGLIEVHAPADAPVRIDGAIAGLGPAVSLVAAPGIHEVRVELDGHSTEDVIEVRPGKTARVRSAPGP